MTILPPPAAHELLYGTQLITPVGPSTVLADMDFETYSEAGYVWREDLAKWISPLGEGKAKKGLELVGLQVYAEHPSTEVLCLAYDLKDGKGPRLWTPRHPLPVELFAHLASGKLVEAFNATFEERIWTHVCVPKYGFPPLPVRQLRCAAAKSRAYCLPPSLAKVGQVLNIAEAKDEGGKELIRKLSVPRQPTKMDKSKRRTALTHVTDHVAMAKYCLQDIKAEAEVSSLIPDLIPSELEFWLADQDCNREGVKIDVEAVEKALALLNRKYTEAAAEVRQLTNDAVSDITEVQKITAWLAGYGVHTASLDEEALDALLEKELPEVCRRILTLRSELGSAAVKKFSAMQSTLTATGRITDQFLYHGARTGRDVGRGVQLQNLPNSGPMTRKCGQCSSYFDPSLPSCYHCGTDASFGEVQEWSAEAADGAIAALMADRLEDAYPNPLPALSGSVRGMLTADEGHDFIGSDYSAIEAVVAAALSGEEWRLEVFRKKEDIYIASVSKITGTPIEEYKRFKAETGQHHKDRKLGKVAELACFGPRTQVLTSRGYVAIVDVSAIDKLWDGVEWVNHAGVIDKGRRGVLNLDGVQVTPQHPIYMKGSWMEARKLASSENFLSRALEIGSENLPCLASTWANLAESSQSPSSVLAELNRMASTSPTCVKAVQHVATNAPKRPLGKNLLSIIGVTKTSCPTMNTGGDCSTGLPLLSDAAPNQTTLCTKTMAGGEYPFTPIGLPENVGRKEKGLFFGTQSRLKAGINRSLKWIERTLTKVTPQATSGLSRGKTTCLIKEKCGSLKPKSNAYETVYDIAHAGPRNRFTIKTDSGHLIVHNSGYGGWIGAWLNFGADKFMDEATIKRNILAWRAASPKIVGAWGGQTNGNPWDGDRYYYGLEGAFLQAVLQPNTFIPWRNGVGYIYKGGNVYCQLPSGRFITYHRVILNRHKKWEGLYSISYEGWNTNVKMGPMGWARLETYSGRLFENVVQAVARDILANAAINLHAKGYRLRLRVHDELVVSVPEGWGSVEEMEGIMNTLPAWAEGWPVRSAGGWRGKRFRK